MRIADQRMRYEKNNRLQKTGCNRLTQNSAPHTPDSKGFTLMEVIITIVIVGIISGIAAMIILQGMQTYTKEQNLSDAHYQGRQAMERMAREIRLIRSTADITASTATTLRFTDVNGSALGFQWTNPTLNRWNGVSDDVLASGVAAFSFTYYKNDGTVAVLPADLGLLWFIDIAMTSQQGSETLPMQTRVHPRNF